MMGGAIELARVPEAINLGAVVRATEGPAVPAECFEHDTNACRITRSCRLRAVLGEAVAAFHAVLDRHTLADIMARPIQIGFRTFPRPKRPPPGYVHEHPARHSS